MGPWTYYSPLWVGAGFVVLLNDALRRLVPLWPAWGQWLLVAAAAVGTGVLCQLVLIGAQGAFAQVLPAPGGRSVRGRTAAVTGWLILAWCAGQAFLGLTLISGDLRAYAGAISGALLVAAAVSYLWSLPEAVEDFRSDRRLGE